MSAIERELTRERLSVLSVIGITLLALMIGWGCKTSLENRRQLIERSNVMAAVPDGWLVQDGVGDLIFTTRDPLMPGLRYSVSLVSAAERTLADVASARNRSRGQLLNNYQVIEETPTARKGEEGYKVTFVYIASKPGGEPSIVKGVDYFFKERQQVLVISLESHKENFDAALPQFEQFSDSVSVGEGE
jgi:hypothetical protein